MPLNPLRGLIPGLIALALALSAAATSAATSLTAFQDEAERLQTERRRAMAAPGSLGNQAQPMASPPPAPGSTKAASSSRHVSTCSSCAAGACSPCGWATAN